MEWSPRISDSSVARGAYEGCTTLKLRFGEPGRHFLEHGEMFVDVGFRVLDGDGPLLVPPIGLRQHAPIDHREPVVAPKIDVDIGPIAIIANFLRVKHQRAVDAGAYDVGLQAGFLDDEAIALGELLAEFTDMRVVLSRK